MRRKWFSAQGPAWEITFFRFMKSCTDLVSCKISCIFNEIHSQSLISRTSETPLLIMGSTKEKGHM